MHTGNVLIGPTNSHTQVLLWVPVLLTQDMGLPASDGLR